MHRVREDGYEYVLVGLGTVLSTSGFAFGPTRVGDKVSLICDTYFVEHWKDSYRVRAAGREGTWGKVGEHYQVDYLYPYMINREEQQHER